MNININEQILSKTFLSRKKSLTSGIVIEKICEAKTFGMKVAFKWNNKYTQVETI